MVFNNKLKNIKKRKLKHWFWAYLFILPNFGLFLIFIIYPIISSFWLSFNHYNFSQMTFVGLENYQTILSENIFWQSLKNTTIYAVSVVPANTIIAFLIAGLILHFNKRLQTFFKSIYYLPAVISGIVMSLVWLWIYYPTRAGLLNYILSLVGINEKLWLASPKLALLSIIMMSIVGHQGFGIILYSASIGSIPQDFYESADLDGANWFQKSFYITWPLVKPTSFYLLIIGLAGAFRVFVQPYVMTHGGPVHATITVVYLLYRKAFENSNFGEAAAISFILSLIVFGLSFINHKFFSTDVEY